MTEDQVRDKVRKIVEATGDNVTEVARDFNISPQYLHDFLKGRRGPGKSILKAVGLQKTTIYRASA
jgi:hypothetical protein